MGLGGPQLLYLSRADVEAVGLDVKTTVGLLVSAFREKGYGRVEMPPKPGIHTRPDAFIHAMPAYIPALDKVTTDDRAQFDYYRAIGYFQQTPTPYADLGDIVAGLKPGRERQGERTLAINLGLALDDMAVAPEVYRRARERGLGTILPL